MSRLNALNYGCMNYLKRLQLIGLITVSFLSLKVIQAADVAVRYASVGAIASELQDLAEKALLEGGEPSHYAAIYNVGEYALAARVHMIRSARKSIDIQTFIWVDDVVTRYLFSELEAAARRGVKVRLLVDHLVSFGKDVEPLAAMAVAHRNIEIRYFKPISEFAINGLGVWASVALVDFSKLNRRMHNKLFVVDGRVAIVGGRNYQTVYYDWDEKFNFKDRDIIVCGRVSENMRTSFDAYWEHDFSVPIARFPDVQATLNSWELETPDLVSIRNFDADQFVNVSTLAGQYSLANHVNDGRIYEVGDVEYVCDPPNQLSKSKFRINPKSFHGEKVSKLMRGAETSVVVQSPYLISSRRTKGLVKDILKKNPDLDIHYSTNSLAAADHAVVAAVSLKQLRHQFTRLKDNIYQFKPDPQDLYSFAPRYDEYAVEANRGSQEKSKAPRYSIHAKSMVIDGEIAVIGTSNFDPRSESLNTECGVIIRDKTLAKSLEMEIRRDMAPGNSWVVGKRKCIPVIGQINNLLASVSGMLPVMDVWPTHYTSCFELKKGKEPLPADHPDFNRRYKDVGSFPECANSPLALKTRVLKATFGWAAPVM